MSFTNEDWLPSYEELTVPEIELTSSVLRAGSIQFGKYCDNQCKEFMLCVKESQDPRFCLSLGKEVTRCGFEFFGKVKKNCGVEFTKFWQCLDHSERNMHFRNCRLSQAAFDDCVQEKLGQEKPPPGFFAKTRIVKSDRPKYKLKDQVLPDRIEDPIEPDKAPEPKVKEEVGLHTTPMHL